MSPDNAHCLAAARIDACALANNHVLDWGEQGLVDTLASLDRFGIARCGAGRDRDEATRPAIVELGERGPVVVFSIACTDAGVPPQWAAGGRRAGLFVATELDDHLVRRLR